MIWHERNKKDDQNTKKQSYQNEMNKTFWKISLSAVWKLRSINHKTEGGTKCF